MKRIATLACVPAAVTAVLLAASAAHATPAAQSAQAAHGAPLSQVARVGGLPQVSITMTGKAIRVGGSLVSGGVRIVSHVSGEPSGSPTLVRLNPGVTPAQFFRTLAHSGGDPNAVSKVGAIVVDTQANHGLSWFYAKLAPALYVALDTTGQNPAHWPSTIFRISKSAAPASLPSPAGTVSAYEYGFRGPGTWHDGQLVWFGNRGTVVHMIVAARGSSATVARRIAALLRAGKDNQAQALADNFYSFAGPLSPGGGQEERLGVQPGFWVIACFMDTHGVEHTRLGMVRVIQITR